MNVDPRPGAASTSTVPPCATTMRLYPDFAARLAPGGHALVEAGLGQAPAIAATLAAAGLMPIGRRCDLGGRERCLIAQKTKE